MVSLNQLQLAGFRLHPGPLPEQYRSLLNQVQAKEKKKHKKKKHRGSETPAHEDGRTGKMRFFLSIPYILLHIGTYTEHYINTKEE